MAVAIADGVPTIKDVQTLADEQRLRGPAGSVASTRDLAGVGQHRTRRCSAGSCWLGCELGKGLVGAKEDIGTELPGARAAGWLQAQAETDLDANLVIARWEKEAARGNFKGGPSVIVPSGCGWTTQVGPWR